MSTTDGRPPSDRDAIALTSTELVALLDLLVQYPQHAMARTMLRSALGLARSIQVRAVRCDHDL